MRAIVQLLLPFMRPEARSDPRAAARIAPREPAAAKRRPHRGRSSGRRVSERQAAYDRLVEEMKARYGFRVRKWRRSMSGCAWELIYRDGRRQPMLESPYPKSPLSCAIFLHEVGHHAIGLGAVRPRCLEELRAWEWSLAAMEAHGLEVDDRVRKRMRESMEYAVAKAVRRRARSIPVELVPYLNGARAVRQAKSESIEPDATSIGA